MLTPTRGLLCVLGPQRAGDDVSARHCGRPDGVHPTIPVCCPVGLLWGRGDCGSPECWKQLPRGGPPSSGSRI